MSAPVCLIDTSIFLNLLNIPGKNQEMEAVTTDYKEYVDLGVTFILPMATIIETGNHIAQNGDGQQRRKSAERFVDAIKGTLTETPPWKLNEFPNMHEISNWIDEFPGHAMRNKTAKKPNEGTSFGDLSIIKEYEKCCNRFSKFTKVFIWSLDSDLQSYN